MEKERKIPVSVTRKEIWSFKGAGLVQAPTIFCLETAKDFERLQAIPEHFTEVRFDEKKSELHLKVRFLGRELPLDLELFEERSSEAESRIYFRSLGPWLQGLEGVFLFKDQGRQLTEVGTLAQYQGDIGWIPGWIFSVGAEAVMHHVAEQLRNRLETDYKRSLGP